MAEKWKRAEGESDSEFAWYRAWVTCAHTAHWQAHHWPKPPTRSIEKTAKMLGVPNAALRAAAQKHHWMDRARAYDEHLLDAYVSTQVGSMEEMREAQNQTIRLAQSVLNAALGSIREALAGKNPLGALAKVRLDLPKLMDQIMHYQNLLHGVATQNVKVDFGEDWDLSVLDEQDMRDLVRIQGKIAAAGKK